MTLHYTLQFYDYWHTGSGLSGGTYADQVVNKTAAGLPVVPGKTIKGLLRHAAEDLLELGDAVINQEAIDAIFGQRHEKRRGEDQSGKAEEKKRTIGECWFSSAELPESTTSQITDSQRPQLYEILASTKIDEKTGTAKDSSLRQMEVTIPLTLTGYISGVPNDQQVVLERCLQYVKRLGQNRSRGLGRCTFKIYMP
ncbi:RAMP superfamily CRISPR-associated protein [Neolewinella lacunae]|uniref:CRISPR-associated protein n=1 Tax=Neolewinella lacunae TaxID=1517758 RepID=A0A923T976_9BACT|nr:RAMP superfamily CRISPR-associated protein [Neolewinella lacunae]MBC6995244.1 CRISPR-associated protein [Neolewinella lacunae]MDN3635447.1 RAMP superfamily CRISPR-associated protein [Neolewinella lacunae]